MTKSKKVIQIKKDPARQDGDRLFRVDAKEDGTAEILIYDDIGEGWFGGISADSFARELRALGNRSEINVRINSQGGNVFDAFAIYNQLIRNRARIVVDIDGLAASAASVIAMAGNEVRQARSAWMMIHDPYTIAVGGAEDMRKAGQLLDDMKDTITGIYSDRSGRDRQELADMMTEETWLDGGAALEAGLVDSVTENQAIAAHLDLTRMRFSHVPEELLGEQPTQGRAPGAPPRDTARRARLGHMAARIDKLRRR